MGIRIAAACAWPRPPRRLVLTSSVAACCTIYQSWYQNPAKPATFVYWHTNPGRLAFLLAVGSRVRTRSRSCYRASNGGRRRSELRNHHVSKEVSSRTRVHLVKLLTWALDLQAFVGLVCMLKWTRLSMRTSLGTPHVTKSSKLLHRLASVDGRRESKGVPSGPRRAEPGDWKLESAPQTQLETQWPTFLPFEKASSSGPGLALGGLQRASTFPCCALCSLGCS